MRKREKFDSGFKAKGYKVILPPGKGKDPDILRQALRILAHIEKRKEFFMRKKVLIPTDEVIHISFYSPFILENSGESFPAIFS